MRTYSSPTKISWGCMKQRCDYEGAPNYHRYGGRGITYDLRWVKFSNFQMDMGERPNGHTLDRKDPDGDYTKDNCVWAPMTTQQNNRRNTIFLTIRGKTATIREWATETGLSASRIRARYLRGWSHPNCVCPDTSKKREHSKEWGY